MKHSLRTLARTPGVTVTALLALALGVGANTALFTVVNSVLLRPMAYPQADRIVELTRHYPNDEEPAVSTAKFGFWRGQNHTCDAVSAYNLMPIGVNLTGRGEPQRLTSLPVSADFFRVLGVAPMLGRPFTESEDKPGAGHFAVLSYSLWQRLFAGDRNPVGRTLRLNSAVYTVLGVMPADFDFPAHADLWTPLQLGIDPSDRANLYSVIARLKPGIPLDQARSDFDLVARRFRDQYGTADMGKQESIGVTSYIEWNVSGVREALLVLMGAVGLVLLIACANVANLLLARSAARRHEIAVRTALGASAWRIARQLLSESLLLSLAGAALGIGLARATLPLILRLAPEDLPRATEITLDWRVLLFAIGVAAAAGILFGLYPALQAARTTISNPLRESGGRTSTNRVRHGLVIAEVAISLMLLVGAGLLIATFANLRTVQPGFDPRHVLTAQMAVSEERFSNTAALAALSDRVIHRLHGFPGIEGVANITALPLEMGPDMPFEIIGRAANPDQVNDEFWRAATPEYFSVMRVPLDAGRAFTERDNERAPAVIVVNQAFARRYFPKKSAVGEHIVIGRIMGPSFADRAREIVGVVGDTRESALSQPPRPMMFIPLAQAPDGMTAIGSRLVPLSWVMRTAGDPMGAAEIVRRETNAVSGGVPMANPRALEQVVGASFARQTFTMLLLSIFAGLALLLGAIGLYGVISYSVTQRTREMGIRSALGADRVGLLKLVVGQGMRLVLGGLIIGLAGTVPLARFLASMLYGVEPFDARVVASVTAVLAVVGFAACYVPARRAASVDPMVALREE